MKRIIDLVVRDLFTSEFSELLDSWALIFAIVPFGALIFCGMYIGQFILDSTWLGVVLMFLFPLIGFALLCAIRKGITTARRRVSTPIEPIPAPAKEKEAEAPLVVVRVESENGKRTTYALRRTDALENPYVQKGSAPSVADLRIQFEDLYPEVDWNQVVPEPTKNLTASMQRNSARSA